MESMFVLTVAIMSAQFVFIVAPNRTAAWSSRAAMSNCPSSSVEVRGFLGDLPDITDMRSLSLNSSIRSEVVAVILLRWHRC